MIVMALSGQFATARRALLEEVVGDLVEQSDAVALVVGLEHLGGEHVAAAVPGARLVVDP